MNKYLIEILKIQNSVILPGLGALMVPSQKSGKIVFNPHLKFNDGSLARYIAEKEGIDEQEAQNKVAKFVREIEAEIGKGNSYDMFEFGHFFKNKDAEVDFKMYSADDQPATQPAKAEPKVDKVVTPPVVKKEEKTETAKEAPKKEKKPTTKKPEAKKPAVKKPTKKAKEEKVDATEDSKQAKNTFIPPAAAEVKKDVTEKAAEVEKKATEKVEKVEEKVKDKVEKTEEKVESKTKSIEKGIGAIVHETKEKVEDLKDKIADKDDKKAVTPPVIADSKADDKKTDDKQRKNTFVPPVSKDKEDDNAKAKAGAIAVGAAAVTGAAAASSDGTKTAIEKTKETTVIKETVVKEEKKKRKIWPWILLLLIIGLAVAGYFFRDKVMTFINGDEAIVADSTAVNDSTATETNIIPVEFEDTLANDMADFIDSTATDVDSMDLPVDDIEPIDEPIDEPVEEIAPVVSGTNNGSFHLIGNSFGEEANAERYAQKMQDKGYPAKVLGRFDGLYMVSLKSYDTKEAAQNGRSSVSADAGSAWVFEYSK
jgi:hypothetical protein